MPNDKSPAVYSYRSCWGIVTVSLIRTSSFYIISRILFFASVFKLFPSLSKLIRVRGLLCERLSRHSSTVGNASATALISVVSVDSRHSTRFDC